MTEYDILILDGLTEEARIDFLRILNAKAKDGWRVRAVTLVGVYRVVYTLFKKPRSRRKENVRVPL